VKKNDVSFGMIRTKRAGREARHTNDNRIDQAGETPA
jgi:hypothetical protein